MPGQGTHIAEAALAAKCHGRTLTKEEIAGTLAIDAFNAIGGGRRCTHFTGGGACIFPQYKELRHTTQLQHMDNGAEKTYLVDPYINMDLFQMVNRHIPEGSYKKGIMNHLIGDDIYDHLVQGKIFDLSRQKEGVVVVRETGEVLDEVGFRTKALYNIYPMMDQYFMEKAGITAEFVAEVKDILDAVLSPEQAAFIKKYLNFRPELKWVDTPYFKKADMDALIDEFLVKCV